MAVTNGPTLPKKSPGLLGLSHFRNSRVAKSLWEPIYLNLFTVQLTCPQGMVDTTDDERLNIILEGVSSVGQISTSFGANATEQKYKFAQRSFAGAKPDRTNVDLTLHFNLNLSYDNGSPENYTYKFLREWVDLIYDPLTGREGLKKDYVAPSMTITMQDRAGNPYWQWVFYYIFPTTGVPGPTLNYDSTDLMSCDMTFRADWWDECML